MAQAVVVKFKDVGALVAQKSAAGGELYKAVPQFVTDMAYDKLRQQLADAFKEKGVDADVQVAAVAPSGPPPKSELTKGIAVGAGGVVGLWLVYKLIKAVM